MNCKMSTSKQKHLNPIRFKKINPFLKPYNEKQSTKPSVETSNQNVDPQYQQKQNNRQNHFTFTRQQNLFKNIGNIDKQVKGILRKDKSSDCLLSLQVQNSSQNLNSIKNPHFKKYFEQLLGNNNKLLGKLQKKDKQIQKLGQQLSNYKQKYEKLLQARYQQEKQYRNSRCYTINYCCKSENGDSVHFNGYKSHKKSRCNNEQQYTRQSLRKLKIKLESIDCYQILKSKSKSKNKSTFYSKFRNHFCTQQSQKQQDQMHIQQFSREKKLNESRSEGNFRLSKFNNKI